MRLGSRLASGRWPPEGATARSASLRASIVFAFATSGLGLVLALSGCNADRSSDPAPAAVSGGIADRAGQPVRHPPLTAQLDPIVRTQLAQLRATLDSPDSVAPSDRAERWGQAGIVYQAYAFHEAALDCLARAWQHAPHDPRWLTASAISHQVRGEVEPARACWSEALRLAPHELHARVSLGNLELEEHRLDSAEEHFSTALDQDPACAAAWFGRGKVALARARPQEAVEHLERARGLAPNATEIHYPLGLAYRDLGDMQRARHWLERRGLVQVPLPDPLQARREAAVQGARLLNQQGSRLFEEGAYGEAAEAYRRALQADPEDASSHSNLGSALTRLGRLQEARHHFEESLRLEPGFLRARFNLGTLLAALGDDAGAVLHHRTVLTQEPAHRDARFNLGNALRRLGNFEEAALHHARLIQDHPLHSGGRLALALTYLRLERIEEARGILEEGHRLLPEDPGLATVLARVLATHPNPTRRNGTRALALARALFTREPSVEVLQIEALALAALERRDDARRLLESAREAARAAQQHAVETELSALIAQVSSGAPLARPWPLDHPALNPLPLTPRP